MNIYNQYKTEYFQSVIKNFLNYFESSIFIWIFVTVYVMYMMHTSSFIGYLRTLTVQVLNANF